MRELEDSELEQVAGGFGQYQINDWADSRLMPVSRPYRGVDTRPQILASRPTQLPIPTDNISEPFEDVFLDEGHHMDWFTSKHNDLRHYRKKLLRSQQNTQDSNYSPATLSYKTPYLNR